jgi:hypothetical protein
LGSFCDPQLIGGEARLNAAVIAKATNSRCDVCVLIVHSFRGRRKSSAAHWNARMVIKRVNAKE